MKTNSFALVLAAGIGLISASIHPARACGSYGGDSLISFAQLATSDNPEVSAAAIKRLRAAGPEGLQALFDTYASVIRGHDIASAQLPPQSNATWERVRAALDVVSGQRDCQASHLYWYTDFDEAKVAAKSAGKPILSLRLLGRLDEEYSCANSRFFRTTLYANTEVSRYLRDHFILHWKSVRPVPRITIDFGDGRKIERTITGNSIHYVLSSEGEVIDALPGLYGPRAFLRTLGDAQQAAVRFAALSPAERPAFLRQFHADSSKTISAAYMTDLARVNQIAFTSRTSPPPGSANNPSAQVAAYTVSSKTTVERPMLNSFQKTGDDTWARIAALHQDDAELDAGAKKLIRSKYPTAAEAGPIAISKAGIEYPFISIIRNLQRSIAEDTVRNEYDLHAKIHDWFVTGSIPPNLDRLNSQVYDKLFLTPDSDPWLGLVPANTFSGLDNNGMVTTTTLR